MSPHEFGLTVIEQVHLRAYMFEWVGLSLCQGVNVRVSIDASS